jgi:hypothetical protein
MRPMQCSCRLDLVHYVWYTDQLLFSFLLCLFPNHKKMDTNTLLKWNQSGSVVTIIFACVGTSTKWRALRRIMKWIYWKWKWKKKKSKNKKVFLTIIDWLLDVYMHSYTQAHTYMHKSILRRPEMKRNDHKKQKQKKS